MIAFDTETTGLWWQHDTEAFAIGIQEDGQYSSYYVPINPHTRKPRHQWDPLLKEQVKEIIYGHYPIVFQNANFDIKALCKAGFFSWDEPNSPTFWQSILELGHLAHLHDSTDARFKSSLKDLAPLYLHKNYRSEEELDRLVNRCRTFIHNRDSSWKIASEETIPQATGRWNKSDMWLPLALLREYHDQDELQKYMNNKKYPNDYELMQTIVDDYLKDDCRYTLELAEGFLSSLFHRWEGEVESLLSMNRDLFPVIWKMETLGIPIHRKELNNAINICHEWINRCHRKCVEVSGMEVKTFTPELKRVILYEQYGLTPVHWTKETGLPATDQKTLLKLLDSTTNYDAKQFLTWTLAGAKYDTKCRYLTSYQRVLQRTTMVPYDNKAVQKSTWFLFPSLKSTGTGTTRFSSNNPNSQNIEKAGDPFDKNPEISKILQESPSLRSTFGPETGRDWYAIDYSQLQLRIFAAATKDAALIQSFRDGYDFHDFMAHVIYDLPEHTTPSKQQRTIAKNVNFGFIFGASEAKIDSTAGRPGLYSYLMDCFPNAKQFLDDTKALIRETGEVFTLGGYPLRIPVTKSPWGSWNYASHVGVNYIVQGTEGEIVKKAMVNTDRFLASHYSEGRLVMQIHDEIVFDVPEKTPSSVIGRLCREMERAGDYFGVETPVDADLCVHNLSEKQEVKL
jgi:DNA polymerase I-like protein with 3'-5' exonuclease and polymerase domains